MKFLCPACERLADITEARLVAGTLSLRCDKCGVESSQALPGEAVPQMAAAGEGSSGLAAPEPGQLVFLRALDSALPAQRRDPLQVPDGFCPKCVSRIRLSGPSCASCGLAFAVFNPDEHRPPAPVLDAWRSLTADWQDNGAHDRFLDFASAQEQLAAAGRLYRVQLAHNPDDPYALRGRDEVVRRAAAVSALGASGASVPVPVQRWKLLTVGLALPFLLVVVILLIRLLGAGPP